jgi:hypothetical protein
MCGQSAVFLQLMLEKHILFAKLQNVAAPDPSGLPVLFRFLRVSELDTDLIRNYEALPLVLKHGTCSHEHELEVLNTLLRWTDSSATVYEMYRANLQSWIMQRLPSVQDSPDLRSVYIALYVIVSRTMCTPGILHPAISLINSPVYHYPTEILGLICDLLRTPAVVEPKSFFRFDWPMGGGIHCPPLRCPKTLKLVTSVRLLEIGQQFSPFVTFSMTGATSVSIGFKLTSERFQLGIATGTPQYYDVFLRRGRWYEIEVTLQSKQRTIPRRWHTGGSVQIGEFSCEFDIAQPSEPQEVSLHIAAHDDGIRRRELLCDVANISCSDGRPESWEMCLNPLCVQDHKIYDIHPSIGPVPLEGHFVPFLLSADQVLTSAKVVANFLPLLSRLKNPAFTGRKEYFLYILAVFRQLAQKDEALFEPGLFFAVFSSFLTGIQTQDLEDSLIPALTSFFELFKTSAAQNGIVQSFWLNFNMVISWGIGLTEQFLESDIIQSLDLDLGPV